MKICQVSPEWGGNDNGRRDDHPLIINSMNTLNIKIGHATDTENKTGCTVFLPPAGAIASVDARGHAVSGRELTMLRPEKPNNSINAIFLTGGSAFGLSVGDGIVRWLSERGIGHHTPVRPIPIVAGAVVYDLFHSNGQHPPNGAMGYAACENAHVNNDAQGAVGAAAGVNVGKWSGFENCMTGGFGMAMATVGELVVTATAVVNAIGDVVNPDGSVLAGACGKNGWLVKQHPYRFITDEMMPPAGTNTTLVVLMTNGRFSKNELNHIAQRAHDGMAIAIRPVHTRHDGDTAFAIATQQVDAPYNLAANMTVDVVTRAIRNGVRNQQ